MGKVGELLKEQRESRNLSLSQVEEETKIRRKYLEALEEENYKLIPGKVYVKGFMRTYATFLGLNAAELLQEYEITALDLTPINEGIPSRKKTKRKKQNNFNFQWNPKYNKFLAMIGAIILLVAFANLWHAVLGDTARDEPKQDDILKERTEDPAGLDESYDAADDEAQRPGGDPAEAEEVEEEPAIKGVSIALDATNGRSWVRVRVDGEEVFSGILESGETESFAGDDSINIRLGNPGAIEITLNGENIGIIDEPNPVDREFTGDEGLTGEVNDTEED